MGWQDAPIVEDSAVPLWAQAPIVGAATSKPSGFDVGRFAKNIPKTVGKSGRTVAAGVASLPDTALLIPKTLAAGGEGVLESLGLEGSALERGLQKVRTTPTMRESTVGIIDEATNNQFQPQGTLQKVIMAGGEMAVPAGALSKAQKGAKNAPGMVDAFKGVLNPLGSIEAKAKEVRPAPNVIKKQAKIGAAKVKKVAAKAFKKAEKEGGEVSPEGVNDFIRKMFSAAEPENKRAGRVFKSEPVNKLLKNIYDEYADKSMTLDDFKSLDSKLGEQANSYFSKIDGAAPEYGSIKAIQAALREAVEEAVDNPNLVIKTKGFDSYKKAIQLYASAKRLEEVEDIVNKSLSQQQPARAIRRGFNRLRNQKGFNRFSPEAQDIINKISDESLTDEALKSMTSRLGAVIGVGTGHPVLATILTGLSFLARKGETAKELRSVGALNKTIIKNTGLLNDLGPKTITDTQRGALGLGQNIIARGQQ